MPVPVYVLWDKEYDRQWHYCNWQHRPSCHVLRSDPYSSLLQGMQSGVRWDECLSASWKRPKCLRATWTPHSLSDETPHEVGTVFTPVRTSKRVDLQYKRRGEKRNGVIGRQMVWQMEQLNWINNRRLSRSRSLAHSAHIFPKSRWNKPWEQKFALISKFIFQ